MRALAQALTAIFLLSSLMPCFAKDEGKTEHSSPALTTQSQEPGEGQPRVTNQRRKDTHRLNHMMDQRDWDHRKAGRDWRMRSNSENLGH